ncbi:hypothetical protein E2C01_046627 [Portunus trituberculatus]|uniref:Uncharacterized protein n=1 Tax=Portunus trituberculatus TaxID=210409 RepID=A0A5B7FYC7_PORTR|nr:hypothetical protein [Portunus trituberculatus]
MGARGPEYSGYAGLSFASVTECVASRARGQVWRRLGVPGRHPQTCATKRASVVCQQLRPSISAPRCEESAQSAISANGARPYADAATRLPERVTCHSLQPHRTPSPSLQQEKAAIWSPSSGGVKRPLVSQCAAGRGDNSPAEEEQGGRAPGPKRT